jgi:type II secretion system (T2SS) protein M
MNFGKLGRWKAAILAVGPVLILLRLGVFQSSDTNVVAPSESIPVAELRLDHLRKLAATVPGKEAVLQQATAELNAREAGVLKADTAAQIQAQLLDTIRQAATANGIDARGAEELRVQPLAKDYGEVSVVETFTCGIEQLVNLLADLANRPQIMATNEITITGGNDKKKNVQVRLSLSGVVSKNLVPQPKKGLASF